MVKTKRNNLAHGDEAFGEAARDLTIEELEDIKDEVFVFLDEVLDGMKLFYERKSYIRYNVFVN